MGLRLSTAMALCLLILFSLLPETGNAYADDSLPSFIEGSYKYRVLDADSQTVALAGFSPGHESSPEVKVGKTASDATTGITYRITEISSSAFEGRKTLVTLHLADASNLKTIGKYAFRNAGILAEAPTNTLVFPNSLEVIGVSAFEGNGQSSVSVGLASLDFSQAVNLKTIADSAFRNCGITTLFSDPLRLPPSLERIGDGAFYGNYMLTRIDFTRCYTLHEIGDYAFYNCSIESDMSGSSKYYTRLVIPGSVEQIGTHAFAADSSSIQAIKVISFRSLEPPAIGDKAFSAGGTLEHVYLPTSADEAQYREALLGAYGGEGLPPNLAFSPLGGVVLESYDFDFHEHGTAAYTQGSVGALSLNLYFESKYLAQDLDSQPIAFRVGIVDAEGNLLMQSGLAWAQPADIYHHCAFTCTFDADQMNALGAGVYRIQVWHSSPNETYASTRTLVLTRPYFPEVASLTIRAVSQTPDDDTEEPESEEPAVPPAEVVPEIAPDIQELSRPEPLAQVGDKQFSLIAFSGVCLVCIVLSGNRMKHH